MKVLKENGCCIRLQKNQYFVFHVAYLTLLIQAYALKVDVMIGSTLIV
jgi:hypothetical protein